MRGIFFQPAYISKKRSPWDKNYEAKQKRCNTIGLLSIVKNTISRCLLASRQFAPNFALRRNTALHRPLPTAIPLSFVILRVYAPFMTSLMQFRRYTSRSRPSLFRAFFALVYNFCILKYFFYLRSLIFIFWKFYPVF